jgi:hypothetical protein
LTLCLSLLNTASWINSFFKSTFLGWSLFSYKLCLRVLATYLVGSNIIGQYICILTNNAQELTPYRFGFKCDINRIRKYFLPGPRFEHRSLGWTTDVLANSATVLLQGNMIIIVVIVATAVIANLDIMVILIFWVIMVLIQIYKHCQ